MHYVNRVGLDHVKKKIVEDARRPQGAVGASFSLRWTASPTPGFNTEQAQRRHPAVHGVEGAVATSTTFDHSCHHYPRLSQDMLNTEWKAHLPGTRTSRVLGARRVNAPAKAPPWPCFAPPTTTFLPCWTAAHTKAAR